MSKNKKPVSKRSRTKYPGLDPNFNLRSRWEEITDIASYADQLNDKEKRWLNAFVEEEVNANFKHNGPKLNKSKKNKRRIYSKNNARNRDMLTKAQAQGKALYIEDVFNDEEDLNERLKDVFNLHDESDQGD